MLRKTRYVHLNLSQYIKPSFNGFTAKLAPSSKKGFVKLSVALCSKQDMFCRAKGRKAAEDNGYYLVPVTDVPMRLAEFAAKARGFGNWELMNTSTRRVYANAYAWIWKYFL